jgi:hypothetical protein
MKYIVLLLTFAFVGAFVAYTWKQEGETIKHLFGMGDENGLYGRKSIIEDIHCWIDGDAWKYYYDKRLKEQYERIQAQFGE